MTKKERMAIIDRLLAIKQEELEAKECCEFYTHEAWEEIREEWIQSELDGYETILNERDDIELFGEEYLGEMAEKEIDALLEAYGEEIDALGDEELEELVLAAPASKGGA